MGHKTYNDSPVPRSSQYLFKKLPAVHVLMAYNCFHARRIVVLEVIAFMNVMCLSTNKIFFALVLHVLSLLETNEYPKPLTIANITNEAYCSFFLQRK